MKNVTKVVACIAAAGAVWGWNVSRSDAAFRRYPAPAIPSATYLPQDAYASCTVTPQKFDSWFKAGKTAQNGAVVPANSVTFPHKNNCDFYQWSAQMFLWVTSPATGLYGNNGIVLESPVFYDVSPEDPSTSGRTLIPHLPGGVHVFNMSNHLVKNGPHRLPVIRSKSGKLFEIGKTWILKNEKALVKDGTGSTIELGSIRKSPGGFTFYNKAGNIIQKPKAIISQATHPEKIIHRFVTDAGTIFLDGAGQHIETEEGQATADVLMSQNGSIVYYLTMVNDVYAYYLTAAKTGKIESDSFPTTSTLRDQICAFARAGNKVLPDSNALAMEIKSSWVEAATLKDASGYVTVTAQIPVYNKIADTLWVPYPDSVKTVKMALIGMHIVGSVNGHPEMIWASFEHQSNSPDTAYTYINNQQKVVQIAAENGLHWLLSDNSSNTKYNISRMHANLILPPSGNIDSSAYGDRITADSSKTIGASHTMRQMPWGSTYNITPNQEDKSAAASNTEIISINNTVRKLLVGNDVRKKYIFIGATWTNGGAPPNGNSYSSSNTVPGVAIGTSVLANSTMETYAQATNSSCFSCHNSGEAPFNNQPASLSHMFATIQALNSSYKKQSFPK